MTRQPLLPPPPPPLLAVPYHDDVHGETGYRVRCPACGRDHRFRLEYVGPRPDGPPDVWGYNFDAARPTFDGPPSVVAGAPGQLCRADVRDGMIVFAADCTHPMAGRTVPLAAVPHPPC